MRCMPRGVEALDGRAQLTDAIHHTRTQGQAKPSAVASHPTLYDSLARGGQNAKSNHVEAWSHVVTGAVGVRSPLATIIYTCKSLSGRQIFLLQLIWFGTILQVGWSARCVFHDKLLRSQCRPCF